MFEAIPSETDVPALSVLDPVLALMWAGVNNMVGVLQAQGQHFMDVLPENMVQTNLLILHFCSAVHRFTFVVIVGQKISKPTLAVSNVSGFE